LFSSSSVAWRYYRTQNSVFLNTLANIILHYGVIGAIFFYKPIFELVKIKRIKLAVICYIVLTIGQSLFLNASYYMYLCVFLEALIVDKNEGSLLFSWAGHPTEGQLSVGMRLS